MYYAHFGLQQPPFKITPNTDFFFAGGSRGAVLDALIYAITSGEGIVKVVGEVGSGKTMLCRMLQTLLPDQVESVYLANPSVAPEEVLHAIAFELQLELPPDADRLRVMQALQQYLLERHAAGKRVVVFVEEAQGMPLGTLEQIRLLSNLETRQDKLLQIVLFGQPELDENLNATQIRQLRERITHSFDLGPLTRQEVADYLIFRLRTAGYYGPQLFSKAAIGMIFKASAGLVRRINILADKALLATFSDNAYQVTPKQVRAAIRDSEFGAEQLKRRRRRQTWLVAALILLLGLALGYGLTRWLPRVDPAPQPVVATDVPIVDDDTTGAVVAEPPTAAEAEADSAAASEPETENGAEVGPAEEPADAAAEAQEAPVVEPPAVVVEKAPELPAASDDILQQRIGATERWLQQEAATTYSIQLMGSANDAQLRAQLKLLAGKVGTDNLYAYRTEVKGAPFTTVLYGSYHNRQEAAAALKNLPPALRAYRPHLRTVGGILQETKTVQ